MTQRFLVTFVCLSHTVLIGALGADESSVQATVSKDSVKVAETFQLTVTVTSDAATRIVFPESASALGPFEIMETQTSMGVPDRNDEDLRVSTWNVELETLASGSLEIPSLDIVAIKETGQRIQLATSAIPVNVVSMLPENTDANNLRDIQGEVDVAIPEVPSYRWLVWSLVSFAVFGVAATLIVKLKQRKRWIAAQHWAKTQLKTLISSEAVVQGHAKSAFAEMENVVRTVLESEFPVNAVAASTQELNEFATNNLTQPTAMKLHAFFQESERVRFSGQQRSPAELKSSIENVRQLVDNLCQGGAKSDATEGKT